MYDKGDLKTMLELFAQTVPRSYREKNNKKLEDLMIDAGSDFFDPLESIHYQAHEFFSLTVCKCHKCTAIAPIQHMLMMRFTGVLRDLQQEENIEEREKTLLRELCFLNASISGLMKIAIVGMVKEAVEQGSKMGLQEIAAHIPDDVKDKLLEQLGAEVIMSEVNISDFDDFIKRPSNSDSGDSN